jgi:hypothetical protein
MALNCARFLSTAILVVSVSFLVYNIYETIIATIFISHFPLLVQRLPNFCQSTNPSLQLAVFLTQEVAGSIGAYIRLIGAIFAVSFAVHFYRRKPSYLNMLSKALLFESLYFLLFIPVVINHFIGSTISTSPFLNFNTGLSYLIQIILISPPLFILSLKLKSSSKEASTLSWAFIATPLYLFAVWIKHFFMWLYGVLPMQTQPTLMDTVGTINSLMTLLLAAITVGIACFMIKTNNWKPKMRIYLLSLAAMFAGAYFVIYDFVSIFSPIYSAYLLLTDVWMVSLLVLGIALFYDNRKI